MARILRKEEYNTKRNEILDVALSLIYSKGYEQMTIQDILDRLQISRGALYHYFDSKQALLEALIERMGSQMMDNLLPIVQDPDLTAILKLRRYFETSAQLKSAQKELILSLLGMWYSEDNAIIRQKMSAGSMKYTARLILEPIIYQGIQEGVFTVRYPETVAKIVMGVALSLTDTIVELILARRADPLTLQEIENTLDTYFDTVERILGAPPGSLKIFEADAFKDWLAEPQQETAPE